MYMILGYDHEYRLVPKNGIDGHSGYAGQITVFFTCNTVLKAYEIVS